MAHNRSFAKDDYDTINAKYFAEIRQGKGLCVDPSGWIDTYSDASALIPAIEIGPSHLERYYVDEGNALGATKLQISGLISKWEDRELDSSELTFFHSVSAATFATLVLIFRRGIKTIVFETPGYAVTMNQARQIGLKVVMIPTYKRDRFELSLDSDELRRFSPCAVWLTQPRMSLGFNQNFSPLEALANRLSARDLLIIDEATEQHFPSTLKELRSYPEEEGVPVIRLRGLLKGVGLNGLRLAFALHDSSLREEFEGTQEVVGGSLDIYSLRAAVALSEESDTFRRMLEIANRQTTSLRAVAEKIAYGTSIEVSVLENGYIGCAFINLRDLPGTYREKRHKLLEFCRTRRMPVILGASMRFALDPDYEQIRLNYFNHKDHIVRGMLNLVDFVSLSSA